MSLLSELKTVADACSIPVETGVFSSVPPDLYLVITPMADTFELHADNSPGYDTQEARLSLFVKGQLHRHQRHACRAPAGCGFLHYRPPVHRPRGRYRLSSLRH